MSAQPGVPQRSHFFRLIPHEADLIWQEHARCRDEDPEIFFPGKGKGLGADARKAKNTCKKCEVREQCLEYALKHRERDGIWGGKSENERRDIERQRRRFERERYDRRVR